MLSRVRKAFRKTKPLTYRELDREQNQIGKEELSAYRESEREQQQIDDVGLFRYQELDPTRKQIRLLTIMPGEPHSPLLCNIRHARLSRVRSEEAPEYETLSYVWGDSCAREIIQLTDGCSLQIPCSAARALRAVRYTNHQRVVWIDAVCINQKDVQERSEQVGLMADIYTMARQGLIWLGESDHETKDHISAIKDVLDDAIREIWTFDNLVETVLDPTIERFLSTSQPLRVDESILGSFFARPWFERLWVVQEAALAPQSVCYIGSCTVRFEDVARAAAWIAYKLHHLRLVYDEQTGMRNAAIIWMFTAFASGATRRAYQGRITYRAEPRRWIDVLEALREFHASDARDHVFGLFGLYQAQAGPKKTISPLIVPDYSKSLKEVLRDATLYTMVDSSLEFLEECSWRPDLPTDPNNFPSWIPRWDRPTDRGQDPARFSPLVRRRGIAHRTYHFENAFLRNNRNSPDVLMCSGYPRDQVAEKILSIRANFDAQMLHQLLRNVHKDLVSEAAGSRLGSPTQNVAVTLVAGINYQGRPFYNPEFDLPQAESGFTALRGYLESTGALPPLPQDDLSNQSPEIRLASEYYAALRTACVNRSVYRTKNGYLGLGPKDLEPGDCFVILRDCEFPVILRLANLTGDGRLFLGVTYISNQAVYMRTSSDYRPEGYPEGSWILYRLV